MDFFTGTKGGRAREVLEEEVVRTNVSTVNDEGVLLCHTL